MKTTTTALAFALAAMSAQASIVTRDIDYEQNGVKLRGFLAYDDATAKAGKLPGVLVVHEWWGLNDYVKAPPFEGRQASGRARRPRMVGPERLRQGPRGEARQPGVCRVRPRHVRQGRARDGPEGGRGARRAVPREAAHGRARPGGARPAAWHGPGRAQAGLDQLLGTGLVDPSRVAAIGYCFGGSTVQALAYAGAPLAGIVSFHGGLVPASADAAARLKAKILICHGALDPSLKREDIDAYVKSLDDGKVDYRFVQYAGALHAFTNPDADAI